MSTIAVGDIHGNAAALDDLLGQLRREVTRADVVVFLGDYIDRGPKSKECVEAILAFQDEAVADVVCLCGNHEDWLLQTRQDYHRHSWLLAMDAFETIRSYSTNAAQVLREAARAARGELYVGSRPLPYDVFFDSMPPAHVRFFESLRAYYQGPDCVCVHGGLDPLIGGVAGQSRYALMWGTNDFPERYDGVDVVVYGHRNNAVLSADGWPSPAIRGQTIGIDTISHGVLTAIRMPDRRVFQSGRYAAGD